MTARQCLAATLNHKPVDRLRKAVLGDKRWPVKVTQPYQMLGEIDDKLRQALKLDVVGIHTPGTMFGFCNDGWKQFRMFDGTEVVTFSTYKVKGQ